MGTNISTHGRSFMRSKVLLWVAAIAVATPLTGHAQNAPAGSFSLPPGEQESQPPNNVQGPVDTESPPPRRTDQPDEPAQRTTPPVITPVPVPLIDTPAADRPRQRAPARPASTEDAAPRQRPAPAPDRSIPTAQADGQPRDGAAGDIPADNAPTVAPVVPPTLPGDLPSVSTDLSPTLADGDEADGAKDGSTWLWLAAGLIALLSLIMMWWRQRTAAQEATQTALPVATGYTVPTPPLRKPVTPSPATAPQPAPPASAPARQPMASPIPRATVPDMVSAKAQETEATLAPAPLAAPVTPLSPVAAPAPGPVPAPATAQPVSSAAPTPRLLLDYTTLGIDVTLVNAVARYHLGVTNMSDIPINDVMLHGAVVQARRGMPPTIDPMQGDRLLPKLQPIADLEPGTTQRCEGQIRLPLAEIDPIAMQGRLLFVPVVHIWIGYSGPDGARYAVTQSFVLGEESSPPGQRVGPLRLDLGPRRFTGIGQRPLQPG